MHFDVLAEGELYRSDRTRWPEAVNYNYRGGQHELLLMLEGLTPTEIHHFREGTMRLGFAERFGIISMLWRPKDEPWSDAPYSWWRVSEEMRVPPPVEHSPESRALLLIILVSAEDGIVRTLRSVSMCPRMTRLLHAAIAEQMQNPMTELEYVEAVNRVFAAYPDTEALVRDAIVTCNAGE